MKPRKPLPKTRALPRRDEGRVGHGRIKERPGKRPTAEEARHIARVAAMPCLVSGEQATVHHVTASIHGGRLSRSDQRVVPLAPRFHQVIHDPKISDPQSVERLSHRGFFDKHGIDLFEVANKLWEARND